MLEGRGVIHMKTVTKMWTVRISSQQQETLDEGKSLELIVDQGIVIVQRDSETTLHITFLPQQEAGFGLRGRP